MSRKLPKEETPAWLQEELISEKIEPVKVEEGRAQKATESKADKSLLPNIPKEEDMPRMVLYTRLINLLLSIGMLIASLLSLLTTIDATTGVLACYTVCFSCLLCCYETHLKQVSKLIAKNFGFLYSGKSRCLFMIFIGIIMFNFSLFGKLIGLLMMANAIFNGFLLCLYPQFEEMQRKDAQSEIQDYLASNPAFAQKAVSMGVSAGTSIAQANPDLAKQGMTALIQSQFSNQNQYAKVNSSNA